MASVAVFGYRQIDFSVRVLAVFVVAECLAVLALDVLILSKRGVHSIDAHSF